MRPNVRPAGDQILNRAASKKHFKPIGPRHRRERFVKAIGAGLAGLCVFSTAQAATTWYVSPNGADANAGTSWASAKQTAQAAVNAATNGDTVLVSDGVYFLTSPVKITSAIELTSLNGSSATILDGQQAGRCVTVDGAAATVNGFTLRNGRAVVGGGAYCNGGAIRNCILTNNQAIGSDLNDGKGGGVYVTYGSLSNCLVMYNVAKSTNSYQAAWGGGVYCYGSVVRDCVVSNNLCSSADSANGGGVVLVGGELRKSRVAGNSAIALSYASGGGIYADIMQLSVASFIEACLVASNSVTTTDTYAYTAALASGGGMYIGNGTTVRSTLVIRNTARAFAGFTSGGGVRSSGSVLENCTIAYNDVASYYGHLGAGGGWDPIVLNDLGAGGGVMWGYNDRCYNNIIKFNSANNDPDNGDVNSLSYPTFINSDIGPWFGVFAPAINTLNGTTADPLFVNAAGGDFRLQSGSPCRNAGTNLAWMTSALDLDSNNRLVDGIVDIGAFEVWSQPQLIIIRSGANFILTWPTNPAGSTLQSTTNLVSPPVWGNATDTFQTNGGSISIVLPLTDAEKFYRLVKL